jgi:archaemetzincin
VKRIQLMPFGSVSLELLEELSFGLRREFSTPVEILSAEPEPSFAYNLTRRQYLSTEILATLPSRTTPDTWRLLGVTHVDLYIPILTFVFGEAQLKGNCALVSTHRLQQGFYGLPADELLLHERLLKEAAHELGHTLTLSHCDDYECVMAASHGVEWIDLKTHRFCTACRSSITTRTACQSMR